MSPTQADGRWFEREVRDALPDLYGTALRLTRDRHDAEELVAETVARGWATLDSLHDRACFRGWLFRILTNAFLSDCRARRKWGSTASLDAEERDDGEHFSLFEKLHQPFLLWWGNPEQEFLDRLLREDLERAIAALPDLFRVVVVLADLQGLSYQEIAEALAVPVGTVRSRLARGRGLLQKALWHQAQDAGLRPRRNTPIEPGAT